MNYKYPENLDVISGFGGDYEKQCQKMVISGMEWFDKHLEAKPEFKCYKNVYGLVIENNEDAESLSKQITSIDGGCSGAMHHAAIRHIMYAHEHGWEKYIFEICKPINENQGGI